MSTERLKFLSEHRLLELRSNIGANLKRYMNGNFADLAEQDGWNQEHSVIVDLSPLRKLDPSAGADAEVRNSLLVWEAMQGISPALAMEEQIWARLAHLECLEFCRARWLRAEDAEGQVRDIAAHFFASGRTGIRDDNGISRLWWNAFVARLAMPDDQEKALRTILAKADFRSNFVERTGSVSRAALAAGLVRAMLTKPWVTASEGNFRLFMKAVNKLGGGVLFEVMDAADVDGFLMKCLEIAKADDDDASPPRLKNSSAREGANSVS